MLNALITLKINEFRIKGISKFCNEINSLNTSNSKLWTKINTYCGNKRPIGAIKEVVLDNGESCKDQKTILESFKCKLEDSFKPFNGPEYNDEFYKFIEEKASKIFPKYDPSSIMPKEAFTNPLKVAKILK